MPNEARITLGILIVMFGLLARSKLPAWVIFMGTLAVMMTLGLAPEDALLRGFSNSGVITVGVLFIVAAGMYSTGAITMIADRLIGLPGSLRSAQLKVLPQVAVGSAFLNNTPLVAMMIPVINDLARVTRLATSYLFMPLSFASILGGASTLIGTSTNLIIAGLVLDQIAQGVEAQGLQEINIFAPTLVGGPTAIVGIAFIILAGKRLLPKPKDESKQELVKRTYRAEFQVEKGSPLVGKTILDAGLAGAEGYQLIDFESEVRLSEDLTLDMQLAVEPEPQPQRGLYHRLKKYWKRKKKVPQASPPAEAPELDLNRPLARGDVLVYETDIDALPALWMTIGLKPAVGMDLEGSRYKHHLVEVVVAARNPAVGHLIADLPVREDPPYDAEIVAVSRAEAAPGIPLGDLRIQAGDVGVLEVRDNFFYETRSQIEFSLTRMLQGYSIQRTSRAGLATGITVAMILLAAFDAMSMLNAALLGAGAMLLTGCLSLRAAFRSVEWETLVVLGAAIGMESAVTASGLSAAIARLLASLGGDSAVLALAVVFLGAVIMTNVITNAAAAAFMFPVALSMAQQLQVSFMPFVIVLMLGTSYAFINPAGYQTNLMVQGPGEYEFKDFAKLGLPLTILVGIVAVALAALIYGF